MSINGTIDGIDTIYTTAREMLRWSGEAEELEPMQQILLRDGRFYGYLFDGEGVCVVWTAENQEFTVRQRENPHGVPEKSSAGGIPAATILQTPGNEDQKGDSSKTKDGKRRRKSA